MVSQLTAIREEKERKKKIVEKIINLNQYMKCIDLDGRWLVFQQVSTTFSSAASESLARRAQATAQDPVFQKMKSQFTTDFDFKYVS